MSDTIPGVQSNKTTEVMVLTVFALINALTVIVVCTCCYMWANKIEVNQGLGALLTATVTWTFTSVPGIIKDWISKNYI